MKTINCRSVFISLRGEVSEERIYTMPVPKTLQQMIYTYIENNVELIPFEYVISDNEIKIDYHMENKDDFNEEFIDNLVQTIFPNQFNQYKNTLTQISNYFPNVHLITLGMSYKQQSVNKISLYLFERDLNGKIKYQPTLSLPYGFRYLFTREIWLKVETLFARGEIKIIGFDITKEKIIYKIYLMISPKNMIEYLNNVSEETRKKYILILKKYHDNCHKFILTSIKLSTNKLNGLNLYFN